MPKPDLEHIANLLGPHADPDYYTRPAEERSHMRSSLAWLERLGPPPADDEPESVGENRIRRLIATELMAKAAAR